MTSIASKIVGFSALRGDDDLAGELVATKKFDAVLSKVDGIRPALRNMENYRASDAKPIQWHGFYSLKRGIATQLTAITRDPMAAKGLLRHSSVNTTLAHYIKDVPEVTANGMAQVEQLFSELNTEGQAIQ